MQVLVNGNDLIRVLCHYFSLGRVERKETIFITMAFAILPGGIGFFRTVSSSANFRRDQIFTNKLDHVPHLCYSLSHVHSQSVIVFIPTASQCLQNLLQQYLSFQQQTLLVCLEMLISVVLVQDQVLWQKLVEKMRMNKIVHRIHQVHVLLNLCWIVTELFINSGLQLNLLEWCHLAN